MIIYIPIVLILHLESKMRNPIHLWYMEMQELGYNYTSN